MESANQSTTRMDLNERTMCLGRRVGDFNCTCLATGDLTEGNGSGIVDTRNTRGKEKNRNRRGGKAKSGMGEVKRRETARK